MFDIVDMCLNTHRLSHANSEVGVQPQRSLRASNMFRRTRLEILVISAGALGIWQSANASPNRSATAAENAEALPPGAPASGRSAASNQPKGDTQDKAAIQKNAEAFVAAFHKSDAKALAAFWTTDGDYTPLI